MTERGRIYIRPTTADFASDEAIEDFAARLWQAFTQAEGIHMTTQLTERYADAVAYAATAHAAQRRKGTDIPYVAHLLAVSGSVLEAGGDEDLAIAALLHDVAEDQGGRPRLDDVRARFGDRVADVVEGCSDSLSENPDDKAPYVERKSKHIEHLRTASDDVLLVTAADKLHNARAIHADLVLHGPDMLSRFTGTADQIVWYYRSIIDALSSRDGAPDLVDALRTTVADIELEIAKMPQFELANGPAGDWLRSQQDSLLPEDNVILVRHYEDWRVAHLAGRGNSSSGPLLWSIQACDSVPRYPHDYGYWVWTRGEHWQILVVDGHTSEIAVTFRSDGSWAGPNGRQSAWANVKEGGPDAVIRSLLPRPRRGRW